MSKFLLIDGHAILHRAYHAIPPLTTSKGEPINAVYGFTSMLLKLISDFRPEYLAVAFDLPTPTFRNKLSKDYQAQRPKMENELISQIDLTHKLLNEIGIPFFEKDGYEADDVIGTLVAKATSSTDSHRSVKNSSKSVRINKPGKQSQDANDKISTDSNLEVIIVTGDRDILQLVDNHTKVFMPVKGLSEGKLFGEREVEDKFGIRPSQIVEYKALVGDQSDNYPGVNGIGPKSAAKLIASFGNLEGIYERIGEIEGKKQKDALLANREAAELSRKLAQIETRAPVEFDISKCRLPKLDRLEVEILFDRLEFRSLIPRLGAGNKEHGTKNKTQETEKKTNGKNDKNKQISLF